MVTLLVFLTFIGLTLHYASSKKAGLDRDGHFIQWINDHRLVSRLAGTAFVLMSLILAMNIFGNTSGLIFWMLVSSAVMGLILMLVPSNVLNRYHLFALFAIMLILEQI